jgi:sulfide:quinone oxidoreductase
LSSEDRGVEAIYIVIAGGGVAGLEGLLALHSILRDRVGLTLIAPDRDFVYRPLAVAEPFGLGHALRIPLTRFADDVGAELVIDGVTGVDDARGRVMLGEGGTRAFDALLLAPGGGRWRASKA